MPNFEPIMTGTLIADDLTGACDAAAPLAGRAPIPVFVAPESPEIDWSIAAVDTETRGLAASEAARLVGAAARRLGGRLSRGWLLKKIDSTMRGPIGAELDALLDSCGGTTALVCPSFPGEGRAVVAGALRVHGALAHESAVGRDPAYPAQTSDVAELLRLGARRPVCWLALADVRGGALAEALARSEGRLVVADAETDADLGALAEAALAVRGLVLAGSAGLARAVAVALGEAGSPPPLPLARAWLIAAGSLHPATRAQIAALEAAGVAAIRVEAGRDPDVSRAVDAISRGDPALIASADASGAAPAARAATAAHLARAVAEVLARAQPALVAVTGGETAIALLRAIGAERIEVSGAPARGLALGRAVRPGAASLPLLTKAGGFGPADLFTAMLAPARGARRNA